MTMTCIGTKRGDNYGLVYDDKGRVLGRVFQTQRRLRADMGGGHGTAWTAYVMLPDGTEVGCSLGTRHRDRWSAARAIRAFWTEYESLRYVFYTDWQSRRPLHRALSLFKYDRHDVCGLLKRYRGADPRTHWSISERQQFGVNGVTA